MIIPAIDIIEGRTVRLFQGDYKQAVFYEQTPQELVLSYSQLGAALIHLVDLQGAKDPSRRQLELISELAKATSVPIQTGGGIRSTEDLVDLLNTGVSRAIIGSLAITQTDLVIDWIKDLGPDKIVLALDVNVDAEGNKWLPTQAWQKAGGVRLEEVLDRYLDAGVKHILCTDISRDGTLRGSNEALYTQLTQAYPDLVWQASGGIGQLDDITRVARTGATGIIVGKALLDKRFSYEEASQCWQDA